MEAHYEIKNGDGTTMIPTVGSTSREEFQNQGGNIGWSEKYNCQIFKGYLVPIPLTIFVPDEEEEHEPESSHSELSKKRHTIEGTIEELSQFESSKKRRKIEGNIEELFFKLFRFTNFEEQYLLEMHEAKTGSRVVRSRLFADNNTRKCKAQAYNLSQGNYEVVPVIEDPAYTLASPLNQGISLQERLNGWTVEKRKRDDGRWEKFFYHEGKQFRSFVEVTTFIVYSAKTKRVPKTRQIQTAKLPEIIPSLHHIN